MDYYKLKVLNNKKKILIVLLILIIIGIVCYYFCVYRKDDNEFVLDDNNKVVNDKTELAIDDIYVDIKGYVNKPGVYSFKLSDNARVNDLINKAGGLLKDADTSMINLSKKLDDEMTIIIYSKGEISNYLKTQDELIKKLEICENKINNNACIKNSSNNDTTKININEASLDELLTINGIGEAKAKAIIEYRGKARFKSVEEIKNVEGIGESLFNTIKESITV